MGPFFLRKILFFSGALGLGLTCLGLKLALAFGQLHNTWPTVSVAFLQLSQISSWITFLLSRFDFVGRASRQALQAKCQLLCRTGMLQIFFQKLYRVLLSELVPLLFEADHVLAKWYALRTVNKPFLVSVQISLSGGSLELMGMLLMISASWGKNSASMTEDFHSVVSSFISSCTRVSACKNILGDVTLYVERTGNHLSSHTWILAPLPIAHSPPQTLLY